MTHLPVSTPRPAYASRKDVRDSVTTARAAFEAWRDVAPRDRGQMLYEVAEILEARRTEFIAQIMRSESVKNPAAEAQVNDAIEQWVWYSGWADKYADVTGVNPVAGPYVSFSAPQPHGVVAIIAPPNSSLLGITSAVLPALVSGNTVVVVAAEKFPLSPVGLGHVLATSKIPGGVVNILTGSSAEIAPWLAEHGDVDTLDLAGYRHDDWSDVCATAADSFKQVMAPQPNDAALEQSLDRILAFTQTKTVWSTRSIL